MTFSSQLFTPDSPSYQLHLHHIHIQWKSAPSRRFKKEKKQAETAVLATAAQPCRMSRTLPLIRPRGMSPSSAKQTLEILWGRKLTVPIHWYPQHNKTQVLPMDLFRWTKSVDSALAKINSIPLELRQATHNTQNQHKYVVFADGFCNLIRLRIRPSALR